ncbi:hypothetical protein B0H34DRAFT_841030 [Crassisporium funariophilum]|nr:hypothetical protein B0H34DRAFT_841030 [Crassisporium funariophilum]
MGSTYLRRLHEFSLVTDGEDGLPSIYDWRRNQQEEWNWLSTIPGLLAAMHGVILAIGPHAPPIAFSLWIGGAGLSVCGLFTVQYFPIIAFSITDKDMGSLVKNNNDIINITLLASAIASPVVIALWAELLFVTGMVDYIIESDLQGLRYKVFAGIPLCFGIITVVVTLIFGEMVDRRMKAKYYPQGTPTSHQKTLVKDE